MWGIPRVAYRPAQDDVRIIIRSMSGILTVAERRSLSMTVKNENCAFDLKK